MMSKFGIEKIISYYNAKDDYDYDYVYEAKADRLLSEKTESCRLIKYKGASYKDIIVYFVYRYFNSKHANRIMSFLHFK